MIKFRQIGKLLMAVIQGKSVTISGEENVKEVTKLITQYNSNQDPKTMEAIEDVANKEKNKDIKQINDEVSVVEDQKKQLDADGIVSKEKTKSNIVEELLKTGVNSEYFILSDKGNLQLKDQPYDIPRPLAIEFAERQSEGKTFDHLISFWKLLLLCPNANARNDAFKYLTKQGMTITKQGYFLTYRRLHLKTEINESTSLIEPVKSDVTVPISVIKEFKDKAKKWKQSTKACFIVVNGKGFKMVLKNKLKPENENLGSVFSFTQSSDGAIVSKKGTDVIKKRRIFTDDRTRTFEVEVGKPCQMSRIDCNENGAVECSRGLHVGTPKYVRGNSWLGNVIVVCLINPMHIVSVPYADAHKMRVSEYWPIKEISESEIASFESSDLSEFEYTYMNYESVEMENQLNALRGHIKIIEDDTFKNFTKYKSVQDLEKLENKIKELKEKVVELKINNDPISKSLDLKHIELIVSSRLIAQ